MSTLQVHAADGSASGEMDFSDDLLILDRGSQAMQDAVVAYRANQRAGTASTKTKGEVRGSNRKLWKQKGDRSGTYRTSSEPNLAWRRSRLWPTSARL